MDNQEIIIRISEANELARQSSRTLVPAMKALNEYATPDDIRNKNMHLADSLIKFIKDSEELQAMLQQVEEVA